MASVGACAEQPHQCGESDLKAVGDEEACWKSPVSSKVV